MATVYLNFNCVYIIQSFSDGELQTGKDLIQTIKYALKALNSGKLGLPYAFLSGEQIWEIIKKGILALHVTRKQRRAKLLEMMRTAKAMKINKPQAEIKVLIKRNIKNRPEFIDKLKDYFLLKTDEYPGLFE